MYDYDAVNIVAAAMERAKSTNGATVIPEMFKLGTIDGSSGTFRLTPNGEIDTVVFFGYWTSDGKVKIIPGWNPPKLIRPAGGSVRCC